MKMKIENDIRDIVFENYKAKRQYAVKCVCVNNEVNKI